MKATRLSSVFGVFLAVACGRDAAAQDPDQINECVGFLVSLAQARNEEMQGTFGIGLNNPCLLGAMIGRGRSVTFTMPSHDDRSYCVMAAADLSCQDLDIQLRTNAGTRADEADDNLPWTIVDGGGQLTITVTNFATSASTNFCAVLILEGGGIASEVGPMLTDAAQGLVSRVGSALALSVDTTEGWVMMGGLLESGRSIDMARNYNGDYWVVAWGDSMAEDIDLVAKDANNREIARDDATDNTPGVQFGGQGRGVVTMTMFRASPRAFGVFCVCRE